MSDQDTIAGIASGMGGGIGIIRVSGERAFLTVGEIFRTKRFLSSGQKEKWNRNYLEKKPSHTIQYGMIVKDDGEVLDEVLVLLMKAPKSYTCENVVEIDAHGGPFIIKKILGLLLAHGARLAEPGEFTKRAFLNGRIDLAQAEAVMKMISSENEFALDSAVKQLEGRVSSYIEKIRQEILHAMAYVEAALDDPEHYDLNGYASTLETIIQKELEQLNGLLKHFEDGRVKSEGIRTVIVGKPNVGKSSLMNLLLDEDRAIVTDIAGTTRDVLEETIQIGSLTLHLIDTAGIHDTQDQIEQLGVEKAVGYVNRADFIIYVIDNNTELTEEDDRIISLIQKKRGVVLLNKSDLPPLLDACDLKERIDWDCISFSSKTGDGLDQLKAYITDAFLNGDIAYNNQIYLTSIRHRDAVQDAVDCLCRVLQTIQDGMPEDLYLVDLMDAYKKLGLINGETASEDLVQKIFDEFCMGK